MILAPFGLKRKVGISMEPWLQTVITVFASILASSGFWTWIMARNNKKSANTRMLMGLGHDRIIYLCMKYIERGWISKDEYEDLVTYLYKPYIELGGNGTAKRLMEEVQKLPVQPSEKVVSARR